jgi:hypothetical protein
MTQEDVIRMAREAGFDDLFFFTKDLSLERFAALVAAAEREECAEICASEARHYGKIPDLGHYQQGRGEGATSIEKKIRARGKNV